MSEVCAARGVDLTDTSARTPHSYLSPDTRYAETMIRGRPWNSAARWWPPGTAIPSGRYSSVVGPSRNRP